MKLNVRDRLVLLNVLPQEGTYTTLKLVRELREELSFSAAEHEALTLVTEGTRVSWNDQTEGEPKDITLVGPVKELTLTTFAALDTQGKLRLEHLELYDRLREEATDSIRKLVDEL